MTTALVSGRFGRDTSARDVIRPGVIVSDVVLVAEALIRRYRTERGTLADDPNYGSPLVDYLNRPTTEAERAAMPGQIAAEAEKDDRVERAIVTVSPIERGYSVLIEPVLSDGTSFELSLHVNDVSIEVLGIKETT